MQEKGKCPVCGGEDIEYESFEMFDDMIGYYPSFCKKCGAYFEETYKLEFLENDNIAVSED